MGENLREAIERMGLNPNAFAKLCKKPDGTPLSQSAIVGLINNPKIRPKPETVEAVEKALSQVCPHCHQHWPAANSKQP